METLNLKVIAQAEPENPGFARHSITQPDVQAGQFFIAGEIKLEGVERCASAGEKQVVHELPELLHGPRELAVSTDDAEGLGGLPEVAPAPGQHAGPDGILVWQEAEDVLEDAVRKGADAVAAPPRSGGRGFHALFLSWSSLRSTHETGNGASRTGEGRAGGGAEEERRCGGADDVGTPAVGAEARPLLEESRERLLGLVVSGLMGCLHGLNLLDTNYKRFKGFSGK